MSRLFDNDKTQILPKTAQAKTSGLAVLNSLEKMSIIEEGVGIIARNSNKLDLSNSIYEQE